MHAFKYRCQPRCQIQGPSSLSCKFKLCAVVSLVSLPWRVAVTGCDGNAFGNAIDRHSDAITHGTAVTYMP